MKQLTRNFKQVLILILAISFIGCEDDAVLPKVVAGFTHTINADTGTVTFINTSTEVRNYLWTFGDGSTSTEINPIHTFATGSYTVILKITNVAGASDSFEDTISINIPLPIVLPVTFDAANVAYNVATFNGTTFEIIDNPDVSGTNNKASKVGAITNSGKAYEGINFDLGTQIDFTTDKTISINIWADAAVSVLLKLEKGTGSDVEVTSNHGGTGWETILFNFNSSNKYTRVTLFVDGPGTKTGTFYIDDITQIETPPAPCTPEIAQSLLATDFNLTFQTDPTTSIVEDGGDFEWITNPDLSNALNTSCKVGQVVRSAALQYANNQINLAAPLDFTTKSGFKMKVWSPAIGTKVTVKLEGGVVTEVSKTTTKANEWEELTFDFAGSVTGNNKIVLFFNIDSFTTGTFYFDDFALYGNGSGGGGACTTETTESLTAATFNLTFQTNNVAVIQDGSTYVRSANPKVDVVNGSCFTGKVTNSGTNPWDNIQINLATKLDFNANAGFKIKVYSPKAGTKVTMKLEEIGAPGNNTGDVAVVRTKTGEWEELTFPFPTTADGKFNKIVLFFDLEAADTDTYYFDDLKLYTRTTTGGGGGTTSGIANNGDFETGTLDGWAVYTNGGIIIADNTENNGGTWSGKLVASAPSGLNPTLKQERKGAGTIVAGDKVQVKFDYKGSTAGGGIYSIQSFVEATNGVSQTEVFSVAPTATWQTFTKTFTVGSGDASGGITLEFTSICGGVPGCTSTLYLDNVSITINP